MKTYIIEHVNGSRVPFRVRSDSEESALEKVQSHMGSQDYKVVGVKNER